MRLHDTAARQILPLHPDGPVSIYVCGITPYDAAHLGHAFTYHVFDVLTRRLLAAGRTVRSVRNVTDVDDDILRVSRERAVEWRMLVEQQVERFEREMAAIDILPVTTSPRATSHITEMVDWITLLEREGFAYARDGWVYFEVARFSRYGELSRLNRQEMIALARERGGDPEDARKRDPLDFVLWQPSSEGEPRWPSPWGEGRPGWHIECSVIARHHLGDTVDVHGGGDDLIYPHHESEIAQTEAVDGHPLARHWVHVAMVEMDGIKMSKSLGNLVFVSDALRAAPPAAVRLLLASHHHRTSWEYDDLELRTASARHRAYLDCVHRGGVLDKDEASELERAFFDRLDDDLDTPGALLVLDGMALAADRRAAQNARHGVGIGAVLPRLLAVLGVDLAAAEA